MPKFRQKYTKSKYKHVYKYNDGYGDRWARGKMCGLGVKSSYMTEREAAIAADLILIENGKEPVNILKRK